MYARCQIVFFSLSGSTELVAARIGAGVQSAGAEVSLYNIGAQTPPPVSSCDLLGIGFPVYYFRPPFNVMDYARRLPDLSGKPFFVFLTHGTYEYDAGRILARILTKKHGRPVGYFETKALGQFLPYALQGYRAAYGHPTDAELDSAQRFGRAIAAGTQDTPAAGRLAGPGLVYRLERFAANRWMATNLYPRTFRADAGCTGCGVCVRTCPTKNIQMTQAKRPSWGRNCILCLYCQGKCPQDAIHSALDWPLFMPFYRYNVKRARRDRSLDGVNVSHSHGKTVLIG